MVNLDKKSQTMTEVLIAGVIALMLFTSAFGAFLFIKSVQDYSMAEYDLQRDVNMTLGRMIRNTEEAGAFYGLRSGRSFEIESVSEIKYTAGDGNERKIYREGDSIIYESPLQSPSKNVILTAPPGSILTLRFWEPVEFMDNETLGIYIGVTRQIRDRTVSGSASTYVNLRNVPK